MKKIVFLTGAGISAESGISTFRDSDGLWENYKVEDVASIEGWYSNPELMVNFYNERRAQLPNVKPNDAHLLVAELEKHFQVTVVTQNVDDLHERAGSSNIIHLHGELTKACSDKGKRCVREIGYEPFQYGERTEDGGMMRPFIVWFGEDVPMMEAAIKEVEEADILIVVGTSLNVYPAAGLLYYAKDNAAIYVIDPKDVKPISRLVVFIKEKASVGMKQLYNKLVESK